MHPYKRGNETPTKIDSGLSYVNVNVSDEVMVIK